jgi:hypothetical protein
VLLWKMGDPVNLGGDVISYWSYHQKGKRAMASLEKVVGKYLKERGASFFFRKRS